MDLRNRVCVVTGATSGIGRATAIALARTGATLALVARNRARADETVAEIAAATGNRDVTVFLADLASQADIRRVAGQLLDRYPRIHVLVNNAGVMNLQRKTTVDGLEETFAVNHLGYFLLTLLLLDRLKASAPARIVNVASDAHKFVPGMNWDDLGYERSYSSWRAYGQSKLANILFTQELARRLERTGVTANAVHPGAVATRLGHQNAWWAALLAKALGVFFRTAERGAETSIRLASAPELAGVTGRYFANGREARTSTPARDADAARRLWDVSARLVGLPAEPPGW